MNKCSHVLSWADKKWGCFPCGKRKVNIGVRIAYPLRGRDGQGTDYREDLARPRHEYMQDPNWRPGLQDPECYVDGPRAVAKLWDKRQRQGWTEDKDRLATIMNEPESEMDSLSSEQIIMESYVEAAAEGFTLESDND